MAMSRERAEAALAPLVATVGRLCYDDGSMIVNDEFTVVPAIRVEPGHEPNANFTPIDEHSMGLAVSEGLLAVPDDTAIKFAFAHELGNGFNGPLLESLALDPDELPSSAPEVIADLGAANVLLQTGNSWDDVLVTVDNWSKSRIFDEFWAGQHPPGTERAALVHSLRDLMTAEMSFDDAAKTLCAEAPESPWN